MNIKKLSTWCFALVSGLFFSTQAMAYCSMAQNSNFTFALCNVGNSIVSCYCPNALDCTNSNYWVCAGLTPSGGGSSAILGTIDAEKNIKDLIERAVDGASTR